MAIYKYSTQASGSIAFTTTDSFIFDTITAASLGITVSGLDVVITDGTKTFTLTGFDIKKISSTNFTFDDGSKLQIGDGTTATINDDKDNIIIGTEYDDYFDGLGNTPTTGIGDTVSYATATSGVQVNLGLTGAQDTLGAGFDKILNIENIIGSIFNDTLTGTAGNNILNGGAGIDSLTGGDGNDTYIVTAGDTITDSAGTDTVQSSVDYSLVDINLENLTLLPGAVNGKGNSGANILTGNTAANVLDGAGGADTLIGGAGNDTYIVGSIGDTITEGAGTGNGIDTVISTITLSTPLAANVENLRLLGSGSLNGTGNALDNIIYASKGANVLNGGDGIDTVSYRYGATKGVTVDLGNTGSQTTFGSGLDTLSNFEKLIGSNYGDTLTAATAANTLDGGAGNDILTGAGNNDTLIGGAGNDTFVVDAAIATTAVAGSVYGISDSAGTDTIRASVSVNISTLTTIENITLTGSTTGLTATGNTLANTLTSNGATGNVLVGGTGNDTYVVSNGNEKITEAAGAGTDTVQSSATFNLNLATNANVENLTLTGLGNINATGNGLANIIIGNSGNNILDGKLGNDNMSGGAGDDTYFVDSSSDVVTEVAGTGATAAAKALSTGNDTVKSSIAITTLVTNVENLTLTGTSNINGTGNTLDNTITGNTGNNTLNGSTGNDTLNGAAGDDILNGGAGNDAMSGGANDDTYVVDSASDTVAEAASEGTDTVQSSVTYTIDTDVENLTLIGSAAINGIGNASANTLTGNAANNTLNGGTGIFADILIGGAGKDTLTGDAGADTFVYKFASESTVTLFDVITDFTTASDKIDVSAIFDETDPTIFDGTDPTTLLTTAFTATGNAQVNYIGDKVSFDIDGDANADFAIALTGVSSLAITDFTF